MVEVGYYLVIGGICSFLVGFVLMLAGAGL